MINTNYKPLTELINYLELKEEILKPKPMKTAMQELLDITYKSISKAHEFQLNNPDKKGDVDIMLNLYNVYRVIIERDMLEKEKEQIIESRNDGIQSTLKGYSISNEEYYNQTYNQNK